MHCISNPTCVRSEVVAVHPPCRATQHRQVWSALPQGGKDTSTVVVSPRMALLPDATWQGIVAHELGHCIDFALFGR